MHIWPIESLVYETWDEARREYIILQRWHPISVLLTRLLLSGRLSDLNGSYCSSSTLEEHLRKCLLRFGCWHIGGRCFGWLLKDHRVGDSQLSFSGKGKQAYQGVWSREKKRQPIPAICKVRECSNELEIQRTKPRVFLIKQDTCKGTKYHLTILKQENSHGSHWQFCLLRQHLHTVIDFWMSSPEMALKMFLNSGTF